MCRMHLMLLQLQPWHYGSSCCCCSVPVRAIEVAQLLLLLLVLLQHAFGEPQPPCCCLLQPVLLSRLGVQVVLLLLLGGRLGRWLLAEDLNCTVVWATCRKCESPPWGPAATKDDWQVISIQLKPQWVRCNLSRKRVCVLSHEGQVRGAAKCARTCTCRMLHQ